MTRCSYSGWKITWTWITGRHFCDKESTLCQWLGYTVQLFYCDKAIKCMWCTTCVRLVPANWHFLMMLSISKPSLLSILFSIRIFTFNGSILAEKNFVKITNIILKYHPTLYYWKHHSRMQSKHICIIIKKKSRINIKHPDLSKQKWNVLAQKKVMNRTEMVWSANQSISKCQIHFSKSKRAAVSCGFCSQKTLNDTLGEFEGEVFSFQQVLLQ